MCVYIYIHMYLYVHIHVNTYQMNLSIVFSDFLHDEGRSEVQKQRLHTCTEADVDADIDTDTCTDINTCTDTHRLQSKT